MEKTWRPIFPIAKISVQHTQQWSFALFSLSRGRIWFNGAPNLTLLQRSREIFHIDFNRILTGVGLIWGMRIRTGLGNRLRTLLDIERDRDSAPHSEDPQTGLLTRQALKAQLAGIVASENVSLIVFAAGIDRFEEVRAMIGYAAMTEIVTTMGARASGMVDFRSVARIAPDVIGGFCIAEHSCASALISRLHRNFQDSIAVHGGDLNVDCKIGFALGNRASDPETLIQQAELALGQARTNWRRTCLFSQSEYGSPEKKLGIMRRTA